MCNAIQTRIVEERLVEDERYESMLRLRHNINEVLGMPTPSVLEEVASRMMPHHDRNNATASSGDLPDMPKPASGVGKGPAKRIAGRNPGQELVPAAASAPKRKSGHSREWEIVYGDGEIPEPKRHVGPVRTDVMAIGDVTRDPTAPIAPYIPPTEPQSERNPFPTLNPPMG